MTSTFPVFALISRTVSLRYPGPLGLRMKYETAQYRFGGTPRRTIRIEWSCGLKSSCRSPRTTACSCEIRIWLL